MKKARGKFQEGQSLIEVIIALAIAGLVAVGLVRATTVSIKGSRYSIDQSKITALAQKQIATIVDYRNSNPGDFWEGNYYPLDFNRQDDTIPGYCLLTTVIDATLTPGLLPTTTPDYANAKMAQINVKVFWDEKGTGTQCAGKDYNHSLSFDTYVTN